jgi:hypothetical protein
MILSHCCYCGCDGDGDGVPHAKTCCGITNVTAANVSAATAAIGAIANALWFIYSQ